MIFDNFLFYLFNNFGLVLEIIYKRNLIKKYVKINMEIVLKLKLWFFKIRM